MSTINQIQLPNGSIYDFEDTAAREAASSKADKTLATTSANGLMSASDKSKLDGIGAGSNVKSVNGKTGVVSLSKADVGLGNVDNTRDADKHVLANNIQWGGNNIAGNISPLDAATSNLFSGNVMAYANPDGIAVEYSTDGGTTWKDYGADDNSKTRFVTPETGRAGFYLGKNTTAQTATKDLLRITLDARKMGIYCSPQSMLIEISQNGGSDSYVNIEYSTRASDTVFHNLGRYDISGWSGWNSIPINNIPYQAFGTNGWDDQPVIIRLTFGFTSYLSGLESRTAFFVSRMSMIATNRWLTPSSMASVNSIYRLDENQNTTFPAKVTAKSFAGATATSSADGLMSKADKAKLDGIGTGSNVKSVNGKTGAVTLAKGDVGLGNVANLDQSKAIKSITRNGTTFTATALDGTKTTFTQQDTNTTYGVATSSTDGLMSKSDKAKLDGVTAGAITTNAANIKKNADAISAETTRAKAAEKANADTISAEVTRAKKAEEANTQLTNDLKTGLTSGTVKVAKATVADSASSLGKVSTYQTGIPDNGGRRKYLLMYDITDWISAKSNASTRAFDGYFFSRRSGGYVGTNYTGNLSIVASYNGVNSDGSPIKSDNGVSLRLRTTSSTYVPRILHQKSNDKYYLSLMTGGSGRDLILFGIFQGTFIGTWINNEGANNSNGTLPSDYEEYSDGFYIIPYERAICDKNGKDITEYLVAAAYADGAFTFTRGNGSKTVLTIPDAVSNTVNSHIANKSNPHAVTKAQVGLGNVANYDQSKAIKSITRSGTTFTATALDGTTTTFTQQDTNTTYGVATSSADGLMSKTDKAKLDGVAAGADVSQIKTVKVNGTALTPDSSKAVNVTVPTLANNATTTASGMALDARMGKTLSDQISSVKTGAIDQIVNLTAAGWTGDAAPYSQAVNVTGMSSEVLCELFSACSKSATVAERKAYNKAYAIVASGYAETADGKVTFYTDKKPAIDIGVRIKSISKANAVSDQTSSDISNAVDAMSNTLEERIASLWEKIYPVGSIYMSVNATNPAELFGGTWEQIKDRFLLAAGNIYAAGSTGGWDTHIHKYGFQYGAFFGSISMEKDDQSGALQGGTGNPVGSTVAGQAHSLVNNNVAQDTKNIDNTHYKSIADTSSASNMPPYIAVYVWKRTA